MNAVKVLLWNANGLSLRKAELENFLNDERIDVALISETHFTQAYQFKRMRNYHIVACNHPSGRARGGAAVIIKNDIQSHEFLIHQTPELQAAVVSLQLHGVKTNIGAIYAPPGQTIDHTLFSNLFSSLGSRWILGGDYNSKHTVWGSRLINPRGRNLLKAAQKFNCTFLTSGEPTNWPSDHTKIPDLLDFFICKNVSNNYAAVQSIADLSSNHSPVLLTISTTILMKNANLHITNKNTNWEEYREILSQDVDLRIKLKTPDELEAASNAFINLIKSAATRATPKPRTSNLPENLLYPESVRLLVKQRRKARKKWQRTRCPEDKSIFNKLSKETTKLIKSINEKTVTDYVTNLSPNKDKDYSLWKATKRLKQPIANSPPLKTTNEVWCRSDMEKATLFAETLADRFTTNDIASDVVPNTIIENSDPLKLFSPREVADQLDKMNPRKAPGIDQVTTPMLKELPKKGIVLLTLLFNAALRLCFLPDSWKMAKIIMIYKDGKPVHDPNSYRPISLLPAIVKLFEKLVLNRILPFIDENHLIPDIQFGFRNRHSSIEQIHRIVATIDEALENKEYCPAVFMDISQAFDRVWHQGLIHKLSKTLPANYCALFHEYLRNRKFQVSLNSATSTTKDIQAGVPQGSTLSSILFLLYTADFPTPADVTVSLYADDTALTATHTDYLTAVTRLQSAVDTIVAWFHKWKIAINEKKSERVDFSLRSHPYIPILINGVTIPYVSSAKYLGVHLDAKLTWRVHITKKRDQINKLIRKYYWLIGRHSKLNLYNKRLIYTTILKPVWSYGIQLWATAKKSNLKIIQTVQNKAIRLITKAPWFVSNAQLHKDLQIETVDTVARKISTKYLQRLHKHPNIEAIQLLDSTEITRRLSRTKPLDLAN